MKYPYLVFLIFYNILKNNCKTTIQLNIFPLLNLHYELIDVETIRFTLEYHTQGYLGFGFGYSMSSSDCIIANFINEKPVLHDSRCVGYKKPEEDIENNLVLIKGMRNNEKTEFVFERKLKTNDPNDFEIKFGEEIPIIWSYGESDVIEFHLGKGFSRFVINNSKKKHWKIFERIKKKNIN